MWLFAVFLTVPLIEIALFIQIGGWLTLWPTLGIVVATAVVGSALLRWQGLQVLRDLQREIGRGGNPAPQLAHGALVIAGGVMMILPGFFTDSLGILLMVPAIRALLIRLILARATASRPDDTIIEASFTEVPPGPRSH